MEQQILNYWIKNNSGCLGICDKIAIDWEEVLNNCCKGGSKKIDFV